MSALNSPGDIPAGGGNAAGGLFSPGVRPGANAAGGAGDAAGGGGNAAGGGAAAVNAPAPAQQRVPTRAALPGGMEGLLSPGPRIPAGGKKGPKLNTRKIKDILTKYDNDNMSITGADRDTLLEYYTNRNNYEQDVNLKKVYSILYPGANITQGKPYAFGPTPAIPYVHSSSNYGGGSRSRRNSKTRCRKNSKNNRSRRNRKTNRSRRH